MPRQRTDNEKAAYKSIATGARLTQKAVELPHNLLETPNDDPRDQNTTINLRIPQLGGAVANNNITLTSVFNAAYPEAPQVAIQKEQQRFQGADKAVARSSRNFYDHMATDEVKHANSIAELSVDMGISEEKIGTMVQELQVKLIEADRLIVDTVAVPGGTAGVDRTTDPHTINVRRNLDAQGKTTLLGNLADNLGAWTDADKAKLMTVALDINDDPTQVGGGGAAASRKAPNVVATEFATTLASAKKTTQKLMAKLKTTANKYSQKIKTLQDAIDSNVAVHTQVGGVSQPDLIAALDAHNKALTETIKLSGRKEHMMDAVINAVGKTTDWDFLAKEMADIDIGIDLEQDPKGIKGQICERLKNPVTRAKLQKSLSKHPWLCRTKVTVTVNRDGKITHTSSSPKH